MIISQKSFKDFDTNTTASPEQRPWVESFKAAEKYLINDGNKSSGSVYKSLKETNYIKILKVLEEGIIRKVWTKVLQRYNLLHSNLTSSPRCLMDDVSPTLRSAVLLHGMFLWTRLVLVPSRGDHLYSTLSCHFFFNSCICFIVKSFDTPWFIIFRFARDFRSLSLSSNWRKRTIIGLDLLLTGLPKRCTRWISSLHHFISHFCLKFLLLSSSCSCDFRFCPLGRHVE